MTTHEYTDPDGDVLTIAHDHRGVWITVTESHDEVTVGPVPIDALRSALDGPDPLDMDGGVTAALIEQEADERHYAGKVGTAAYYWRARTEKAERERDDALERAQRAELASTRLARTVQETWPIVREHGKLQSLLEQAIEARDLYCDDLTIMKRREREASTRAEKAEQDRDEWREEAETSERNADTYRTQLAAQEPAVIEKMRHMLPGDITDELVQRALNAWHGLEHRSTALHGPDDWTRMRLALRDALTEPPKRPDGAEEIQRLIEEVDGGSVTSPKAERIADFLAERGVRATGTEA